MSDKRRTSHPFLQQYLNGEVLADDIDDFVEAWHQNPGKKKIFEFLGMTKEEYSLWLCDPESLAEIAGARAANVSLTGVVRSLVAELPADSSRAKPLWRWLGQQAEPRAAK
ncbi:MAG TPA: hypothetical protein VFQ90_06610 [Stellaceae bacterium]|jgi:hypothetical protein|nr:hypothetical protein [Stellaceae bacterium]